jgi:hypothetical protein
MISFVGFNWRVPRNRPQSDNGLSESPRYDFSRLQRDDYIDDDYMGC